MDQAEFATPFGLRLSHDRVGAVRVVRAAGEVDAATAEMLHEAAMLGGGEEPTTLVLDLSEVTFLDSAGLTVLVRVERKQRAQGGSLAVVTRNRAVLRVLEITGLDRSLTILSTVDDALN
ncbi:STAS domain-containing protein [Amycolatopsis sp. NPDC051372]|uniref:STAS domain-containing protein n=1 Tax=Amycolatopsis sp. NPDC051372 TaxID=3155669 RepID=UPI003433DFF2